MGAHNMADNDSCLLVGNLDLNLSQCIISISRSCKTEFVTACGEETDPLEGPSTVSLSITGYASHDIWVGKSAKAGVSIPYIQKYDCENDKIYFICSGRGQSYIAGEGIYLVSLYKSVEGKCEMLSASSTSGPATIYMSQPQTTGYGMTYTGAPFSFITQPEGTEISVGDVLGGTYYLQNFSLECQSGQLPTATYSLIAGIESTE